MILFVTRISKCSWALRFAFLLIYCNATAQSQSSPEFVPPSPNAYSLGKYGDVPVSLYSGIPGIEIPIWDVMEKQLSVKVSLSYHGSGVKVDEIASWVGLGWSLNSGGIITRAVRGRAEYLLSDGTLRPERAALGFYSGSSDYNSRATFIQQSGLQAAANGGVDTEPDQYIFNFNGYSGKFHFDRNGNALLYQHEGLRIKAEYNSGFDFNFIVTTEDGTVYEFKDYEKTFFSGLGQMHITAWYVSKIRKPSGREIVFEYQPIGSITHDIRESSDYVVELSSNPLVTSPIVPHSGMNVGEVRIKRIIADNESIEFKAGLQQRLDYKSTAYPLDSIIVYGGDGEVIRKFKLYTSYFEANNNGKYDRYEPNLFQHLNYRLRLDSIQEFSNEGRSAKPPYRFVYSGDNDPSTDDIYTLPYRLSPRQDHWGYYNGSSNAHIFPGNSEGRTIYSDAWYQHSMPCAETPVNTTIGNGANREPHLEAVKACALKTVHYPTGGHTEYFFESNRWSETRIGGGLRIGKIVDHTGREKAKETIYEYDFRSLEFDPKDFYYKFYCIEYLASHDKFNPDSEVLALYGLTTPTTTNNTDVIKITTYPQAILGGGAIPGYGKVTVYQGNNGYVENYFDDQTTYPDYYGIDDVYDDVDMFQVENIFNSQYITDLSTAGITYNFQLKTGIRDLPYPEPYDNSWKRGVLNMRIIYSKDSLKVKQETYSYNRKLLATIPGFKIVSWNNSSQYIYSKYYVPHAWIGLERYTVQTYGQSWSNFVETTTEYYYDNLAHGQLTREIMIGSDEKRRVTVTCYPGDYSPGTAFIDDMNNKHLAKYPIEQVTYVEHNGTKSILSGVITRYRPGGNGLIDRIDLLETEHAISLGAFKFSNREMAGILPPAGTTSSFLPDGAYKLRLTYDSYDALGNVLQYTSTSGIPVSYLWSYNSEFPVAEAKNATSNEIAYTSFEAEERGGWNYTGAPKLGDFKTGRKYYDLATGSITKSGLSASGSHTFKLSFWARSAGSPGTWTFMGVTESLTTDWQLIQREVTTSSISISGAGIYIDELSLCPTRGDIRTFTYTPSAGITSMTDSNQSTTYFDYDEFGRLETVTDQQKNVVKKYSYRYKER